MHPSPKGLGLVEPVPSLHRTLFTRTPAGEFRPRQGCHERAGFETPRSSEGFEAAAPPNRSVRSAGSDCLPPLDRPGRLWSTQFRLFARTIATSRGMSREHPATVLQVG